MKQRYFFGLGGAAWGLGVALLASAAQANVNGSEIGRSARGCGAAGSCHGASAGATVTLMGPLTVAPGSRNTYTLVINSTLAGFVAGGCDVSVSGATLALNPTQANTRLNAGELVQSAAIARPAGAALEIRFDVVAPAAPGTVSVSAAGNAVNLNRLASGDAWAVAPLRVTVEGAPEDGGALPTDAGAIEDVGESDADPFAGDGSVAFDASRSLAYGRCAVAGGASRASPSAVALWAVVALAHAVRRRRR